MSACYSCASHTSMYVEDKIILSLRFQQDDSELNRKMVARILRSEYKRYSSMVTRVNTRVH